jgi:hypothetical protein
MDPDENLREQERLLTKRFSSADDNQLREYVRTAKADNERLWELRQALYDWIRDGGFEPDWSQAPRAAHYYGKDR